MPLYELSLLFKVLPRKDTADALKRIGTYLLEKGVILKKLENLGTKDLPYRMGIMDNCHFKGSYFVYTFDGSPRSFSDIENVCKRDIDVLRHGIVDIYKEFNKECTLEEEFLPPALRPSVQELMAKGKKNKAAKQYTLRKRVGEAKNPKYFDIYM